MLNTALEAKQPAAVRYPRGRGPGVEGDGGRGDDPWGLGARSVRVEKIAFLGFGSMTNVLAPVAKA